MRIHTGLVLALVACTGDADLTNDGIGTESGGDCYAQTRVSQTIFAGDTDSLVLADVPDRWEVERFTNQAGYLAHPTVPQDNDRPEISVTNSAQIERSLADLLSAELVAVTTVPFAGEDVTVYNQRNQPEHGVNLEGYFPLEPGGTEVMQVTILADIIGSDDLEESCQDSVLTLATLVSESIRENPDWGG